jgi:hypothetical protein
MWSRRRALYLKIFWKSNVSSAVRGRQETYAIGVGLALVLALPLPAVLDQLAVLGLLPVELGEVVALVVGSDVERLQAVCTPRRSARLSEAETEHALDPRTR